MPGAVDIAIARRTTSGAACSDRRGGLDPRSYHVLRSLASRSRYKPMLARPRRRRRHAPTSQAARLSDSFACHSPLREQRAIAHILGTLDDKIELNRRMNETLEAMARALFKSWFVDFDPVRAKLEGRWRRGESLPGLPAHLYDLFPDRLVDSELGEIPEGWEVKPLDKVADFVNGAPCQRFPAKPGEPSCLQSRFGNSTRGSRPKPTGYNKMCQRNTWRGRRRTVLVVRFAQLQGLDRRPRFRQSARLQGDIRLLPPLVLSFLDTAPPPDFQGNCGRKSHNHGAYQARPAIRGDDAVPAGYATPSDGQGFRSASDRRVAADLESRALSGLRDMILQKLISGGFSFSRRRIRKRSLMTGTDDLSALREQPFSDAVKKLEGLLTQSGRAFLLVRVTVSTRTPVDGRAHLSCA